MRISIDTNFIRIQKREMIVTFEQMTMQRLIVDRYRLRSNQIFEKRCRQNS